MPCYEVNLVSVEFKAESVKLLKAAAESLGLDYAGSGFGVTRIGQVKLQNGQATATNQADINALKRQYAVESVKAAARAKGWAGSWKTTGGKVQATYKKF